MAPKGEWDEAALYADADRRAARYIVDQANRRVFPDAGQLADLARFDEVLTAAGCDAQATLALLDDVGSPATVASNGPNYFGFVIGACLPVAGAADRLTLAWDQCASSHLNSPAVAKIEAVAARWVLDILDLPREAAVGFGTSATACSLACITAARRALLARQGWDVDQDGLIGAPEVRVVVSETAHVTLRKALRILGFGLRHLIVAPTDGQGRIDPSRLPALDERTLLCLQAGEVNTGAFDPFAALTASARKAGAWVHVDGAFGLWARASQNFAALTVGVDAADSWTTDGHKCLNTPYDGAMAICRNGDALAAAMNADAVYAVGARDSQKNLGLEFSRRGRGVPIWAALRTLGRTGVAAMVDTQCRLARRLAEGLAGAGLIVINDVPFNQVLVRCARDADTLALVERAQQSGRLWFGATIWQGRPAFRLSISSWRTEGVHIDGAIATIGAINRELADQ